MLTNYIHDNFISTTVTKLDLRCSTAYNIPDEFITYPVNFGDRVFEKIFRQHVPFEIVANFTNHKKVHSK